MTIEEMIGADLAADAGVAALVGTRIYPGPLAQEATLPAIGFGRISRVVDYTHSGPSTLEDGRFQFDCWAATHTGAIALARAVRTAFEGKTMLGVSFVENEIDDKDTETGNWRRVLDMMISYEEE